MLSRSVRAPAPVQCPTTFQRATTSTAARQNVFLGSRKEAANQAPTSSEPDAVDPPSPRLRLVDVLLGGAASRIQRGTCTCIHCRGKGAAPCSACSGGGIVQPGHGTARMNMVRHVMDKVSNMAGVGTKSSGQEWLQTNRCRRCHGVGQLVCVNCKGTGLRYKSGPDDACELPQ